MWRVDDSRSRGLVLAFLVLVCLRLNALADTFHPDRWSIGRILFVFSRRLAGRCTQCSRSPS